MEHRRSWQRDDARQRSSQFSPGIGNVLSLCFPRTPLLGHISRHPTLSGNWQSRLPRHLLGSQSGAAHRSHENLWQGSQRARDQDFRQRSNSSSAFLGLSDRVRAARSQQSREQGRQQRLAPQDLRHRLDDSQRGYPRHQVLDDHQPDRVFLLSE